ncbi:DinB family protein [Catenulispora sp. NL8]|uniref:DinB family protein n=1 Tax=Catenulispora pinistramenti TaxID=2705254 RepID=A0ABS5L1C8_9ACTN|nr:DinB family protein [Catenulispora pinistramenti]MBS2552055.1 DinB family protein [Catenulispora pinistramenti]
MSDLGPPAVVAGEKETLLAFLRYLREAIIRKVEGLPDDVARRPGVPSGTSPLGMLKHLSGAELVWLEWAFLGRDPFPDTSMEVAETDTVARCVAAYRAATVRADALWASLDDLDAVSVREDRTLRWILVHTVEELARHAGQLDILRELIDGDVGR